MDTHDNGKHATSSCDLPKAGIAPRPGGRGATTMTDSSTRPVCVPDFAEAEDWEADGTGSVLDSPGRIPQEEDVLVNGGLPETEPALALPSIVGLDAPRVTEIGVTDMTIEWSQPILAFPKDKPLASPYSLEFTLEYALFSPDQSVSRLSWRSAYRGPHLRVQVHDLRPGRMYAIRVGCRPLALAIDPETTPLAFSTHVLCGTNPTPPGRPRAPFLTSRARTTLKFKWLPPTEDGGRQIVYYSLFVRPPPSGFEHNVDQEGYAEVYRGLETSFKVSRLSPGRRYAATLQAVNEIGLSSLSPIVEVVTQASVPERPEPPVVVESSPSSVLLRWHVPADNGDPVSHFVLEGDDGGGADFHVVYRGRSNECQISQLQSAKTYQFRVCAINSVGNSLWSPVCSAQTNHTIAKAPHSFKLLGAHRSHVTLSWEAPADTGGTAIQFYEAELRPKSRAAIIDGMPDEWVVVYQGAPAVCTVSNLKAGCTYALRVRAFNAAGYGDYSVPLNTNTSPTVPDPPGTPEAVEVSQTTMVIKWAPPLHDGGSLITSYRLDCTTEVSPDGRTAANGHGQAAEITGYPDAPSNHGNTIVYQGPEIQARVQGLQPGQDYYFRVHALNSQGVSVWSTLGCFRTKPGLPLQPYLDATTCTSKENSITLTWKEPYCQGAPINSYTLQYADTSTCASHSQTDLASVCEEEHGTDQASVVSDSMHSDDGHGHSTETQSNCSAAPDIPSADAGQDGNKQNGVHNKAKVNGQAKLPIRFLTAYQGLDTKCDIKGLQPYNEYQLRLKAANSVGSSPWSAIIKVKTAAAAPSAPRPLQAEALSSSCIRVEWLEPSRSNGAAVTQYVVEYNQTMYRGKAQQRTRCYVGRESSCEVDGLLSGKEYAFRIRALNAKGPGNWSDSVTSSTLPAPPDAPGMPGFSNRTSSSVRVKWSVPLEDNGMPVTEYRLEMAARVPDSFKGVWSGLDTSAKVSSLNAGEQYFFRVQALNAVGPGPFSEVASASTAKHPPLPPLSVTTDPKTTQSGAPAVHVSWQPPPSDPQRADCAGYEVEAVDTATTSAQKLLAAVAPKLTSHVLTGLRPATKYQVRVRCIGANSSGHGDWSHHCVVATPSVNPKTQTDVTVPERVAGGSFSKKKLRTSRSSGALDAASSDIVPSHQTSSKPLKGAVPASGAAVAKGRPKKNFLGLSATTMKTVRTAFRWTRFICLLGVLAAILWYLFQSYQGSKDDF